MKTHGDAAWETYPSYFEIVVPRIVDFLERRGLTITFFVVGKDVCLNENKPYITMLAEAGHEIGNHSYSHEPWLHLYSEEQIEEELARTEDGIASITGTRPIGFRGPGYSVSETVLRVLSRRGYAYDCSTLPTFLGPVARTYYFMTTKLSQEEREQRKKLFGTFAEGLRPNKPYNWQLDDSLLLEIPVTTMPLVKVPIHASYVLYLANFSKHLALAYFRTALLMCRLTGVKPSLLLHPLDFMNGDDVPELGFFPAMRQKLDDKLAIMDRILTLMTNQYTAVTMYEFAQQVQQGNPMRMVEPHFR